MGARGDAELVGVASDFLKDYNVRYGNTSEFQRFKGLKENLSSLYPDVAPSAPSFVIPEEISVAFDRRGVPKLVAVLTLPDDSVTDAEKGKVRQTLVPYCGSVCVGAAAQLESGLSRTASAGFDVRNVEHTAATHHETTAPGSL
jgi:hypothetical protein